MGSESRSHELCWTPAMQGMTIMIGMILFCSSCLFSGCVGPVAGLYPPPTDQQVTSVFVMRHGRHVGIIVPTASASRSDWREVDELGSDYAELGWADRYYNMAGAPEWFRIVRALLLPSASILKVVPVDSHPTEYCTGNGIVQVDVSTEGYQRICAFIDRTYARDKDGGVRRISVEPSCWIYAANGRYYYPKTSNVWTARALRQAGCPIRPIRCATADALFSRVERFGKVIRKHRSLSEQLDESMDRSDGVGDEE